MEEDISSAVDNDEKVGRLLALCQQFLALRERIELDQRAKQPLLLQVVTQLNILICPTITMIV